MTPRLAELLLRLMLPKGIVRDGVLGDLREDYHELQTANSASAARLWFWRQSLALATRYAWNRTVCRFVRSGPENADGKAGPKQRWSSVRRLSTALAHDVRDAIRTVANQPTFAAVVCVTLALGIGANTALFSVLHGVLLSQLPYPDADRVVTLWEHDLDYEWTHNALTAADLLDYQSQNNTFECIGGFSRGSATLIGDGDPQRISVHQVTSEVLETTAVPPALGRLLLPADDVPGAENVAVLSHGLWLRAFGGDSGVVGRTLSLDRGDYTIVGVMPRQFLWTVWGEPETWLPFRLDEEQRADRSNHFIVGVGRIRSNVDIDQAKEDLNAIAARLEREYPETNKASRVTVESMKTAMVGDVGLTLWLIMGAAGFVLLIGCANIANLFLSRGVTRQREMAVRASLGASRGRLLSQLATESVLLAIVGGAMGLGLAHFGVDIFLALEPGGLPRSEVIETSGPVLLFCLVASLLASVVFGTAPSLLVSGTQLTSALRDLSSHLAQRPSTKRVKNALAVLQMATAVILLAGAGLLARSFMRLHAVDPGFQIESVLMADIALGGERYSASAERSRFLDELLTRLELNASIERATVASPPPISIAPQIWTWIVGREPANEQPPTTARVYASPGYFEVLGISLTAGRLFDERDRQDSPRVVVINQEMARRLWPEEDPIGHQFRLGLRDYPPMEIVGVVSDIRQYGMRYGAYPTAFLPIAQELQWTFTVMLKTRQDPLAVVTALRSSVRGLDPQLAIDHVRTLEAHVGANVASPRFLMLLAGTFAAVALALAGAGIYGVVSYAVSQRTHEIGLRMALGARRQQVVGSVLSQGLMLAAVAVAVGLPLAYAFARTMRSMLYQIGPADPLTLGLIAAVVLAIALVACYVPAAKAGRSDPLVALRVD